ncbi:4-(cytidine 5'-diphospho)-2-C-methyl-D-erythritol kinase [uncultured Acetobacteroides sp.]|uniref:4-(cytidine 5'-diphospho)-2-C-methyl-D-erythritol kinase n=1 Tax=uncultured Acetobacteroides sp. TaxID=1760811 RepID=UPI0029F5A46E|nr:4-(cytidine 5'-diphospho)-2-C-methyl-D-erythritol kinase [uncultured Acetobacteroides sp.]
MVVFPNAKINLGLYVVEKRTDGFHNLETIFYPVPWRDALEAVPATGSETTLTTTGLAVDAPSEKNLVMRAYRLLAEEYHLPKLNIYLHKAIPFGAGLGGGSADAAFMLTMLNQLFGLGIPEGKLAEYAATLGSDCAFFVYNRPMMASGRGEVLSPIEVDLSGYTIVLVKPPFGISTPEAFSGITPKQPQIALSEAIKQPVERWKDVLFNDFEPHLFCNHPQLAAIKQQLYDNGATYAAMSGSGSTIFGIFKDNVEVVVKNCTVFTAML